MSQRSDHMVLLLLNVDRLLVTPELIKADEQLSVELWDSDRSTADDIVGKVELSMQKMIQHPAKMYPQVSKLTGMEADSEMPGELHWEVGYFSKPQFRPALRTDGKNRNLPEPLKDKPELQDDKGTLTNETEDAVAHTPPDPLWPSGICSVVIHQIVNLELENIKGSEGKRKGREYEPAKEAGENTEEESKKLPNSYCTILYNDQLVCFGRSTSQTRSDRFLGIPNSRKGRQQQANLQCRYGKIYAGLAFGHCDNYGTRPKIPTA